MNTPIKAIVFDIGGVLIDWDPRYLYRKLFKAEEEMERFLHTVCHHSWNLELDRGANWNDAVATLSEKFPDHKDNIRAYHDRWIEMVQGPIHETVDIMMALRHMGYKLYAITNYSREKLDLTIKEYPFLRGFDGMIVSGDEKLVKPDPAIYQLLLDRYDLNPRQLLFIDDRRENVQAAWDKGFHAVQFLSPAQLEKDLMDFGILQSEDVHDHDDEPARGCGGGCTCHG